MVNLNAHVDCAFRLVIIDFILQTVQLTSVRHGYGYYWQYEHERSRNDYQHDDGRGSIHAHLGYVDLSESSRLPVHRRDDAHKLR